MTTEEYTITVQLDPDSRLRLERAAALSHQSSKRFVAEAIEAVAHEVLLEWAIARHRAGTHSFGEVAEATGLAIEEIMIAMGERDPGEALDEFLAAARSMSGRLDYSRFQDLAKRAAATVRRESEEQR